MLHKIEIENFYSIKDRQTIDLRAPANAPKDAPHLSPCWRGSTLRKPKVVALFGANGSGKSNVLKSLSFVRWFLADSFSAADDAAFPFEPFNSEDTIERPTRIAIWTHGAGQPSPDANEQAAQCEYLYEVVLRKYPAPTVLSETISYWPGPAYRKRRLVQRDQRGQVRAARAFDLHGFKGAIDKVLRPNASLISTLAQLAHPLSQNIKGRIGFVFSNIHQEKFDLREDYLTNIYNKQSDIFDDLKIDIARIDLGIERIWIDDSRQLRLQHQGLARPMTLPFESHGTREFFRLYPLLRQALQGNGLAIIDEFDASIHPNLLPEIMDWFRYSGVDRGRNQMDAQLWASLHSASILEHLQKEEVFFCEKQKDGSTSIFGLGDIRSVRRTDNFYKKYLGGVYGAVPVVG